jgi:hypothetical protein
MGGEDTFEAAICEGVRQTYCVLLDNDRIVYAGPIRTCPEITGMTLLLHAADYNLLAEHVQKKRH